MNKQRKRISHASPKVSCTFDIFKIFYEVQWSDAFHTKYSNQLKGIYNETPFNIFLSDFIKCLKQTFISNEKSSNVELTLAFATKFIVSFYNHEEDETHPFINAIFTFLFKNHDVDNVAARINICRLINEMLHSFGLNASLENEVWEQLYICMKKRMTDKVAAVRTRAVNALRRLQDPSSPKCSIIELLLYHMTHDPSPEVRRAVVSTIVITKKTFPVIITRINDVKEDVRSEVVQICCKVTMTMFTVKQRQNILRSGFMDSSVKVQNTIKEKLLLKWLKDCGNDYIKFINALYVQSEVGAETANMCLIEIFKESEKLELLEYIQQKMKDKVIVYDNLDPNVVFFWRALAEYLKPTPDAEGSEVADQFFDQIIPELSVLVNYIQQYFFLNHDISSSSNSSNSNSSSTKESDVEFILSQLMELTKCYNLADETGRKNLTQLCITLLKDKKTTAKSIPVIMNRLTWSIPDVNERISTVAELISDIRDEYMEPDPLLHRTRSLDYEVAKLKERLEVLTNEQIEASQIEDLMVAREVQQEIDGTKEKIFNLQKQSMALSTDHIVNQEENMDPVVVTKYLTIIIELIDSSDVTRLTPTLRGMLDNVVLPGFKKNIKDTALCSLAIKTLGLYCLLDTWLAKERFILFCFMISSGVIEALKIVFDLLLKYGLSFFNLKEESNDQNEADPGEDKEASLRSNIIELLFSLLDSNNKEIKMVAAEGLCKLLLICRIHSHKLVSRLIALWFSPVTTEDPDFRQKLCLFFRAFVVTYGAQLILEKAFLPALYIFYDASVDDPLSEVNKDNVAMLLVSLTHPDLGASTLPKGYCVHAQLAVRICEKLSDYRNTTRDLNAVLTKALTQLTIRSTDIELLTGLIGKVEVLIPKFYSKGEKTSHRNAIKFRSILNKVKRDAELKNGESQLCNTLQSTQLTEKSSVETEAESRIPKSVGDDSSSVQSSDSESVIRIADQDEGMIISASDEDEISNEDEEEDSLEDIGSNRSIEYILEKSLVSSPSDRVRYNTRSARKANHGKRWSEINDRNN